MQPIDFLLTALVCVAWGLNAVAAKVGVTYIPPVALTCMRFIAVLICLSPWLKPVSREQARTLIPAIFFMGGLHFALIFKGTQLSDASTMVIVNQLYVPFSALLAMLWLGEYVGWRRWSGIGLAFLGVVIFALDNSVSSHWAGVGFLLLDAMSMAVGTVLLRRLSGVSPFVMQAWMAAMGVPFLFLASLAFESGQVAAITSAPLIAWEALAFTIVGGSLIGHTCYYILLQRHEVSLVASMLLLSPVVGVLSGVAILGEPFTVNIVLGGLVTLVGVGIVLTRSPMRGIEPAEGV